jgi:hypothetical protein
VGLGFADGRVSLFAGESGAVLWTRTVGGPVLALTVSETRVIAGSSNNMVYVLDAKKNGKQRWKWRTGGDPVGDTAFDGKRLYYLAYDNSLRAHNVRNGHLAWTRILQSRPVGGPVVIGDRVVVAGVTPQLRAFRMKDGSPDGVVGVPGRLINRPQLIAAHGDLPAMLVVVTGGGLVQAIGQTVEPPLVPLERLPGNRLIPETLKR